MHLFNEVDRGLEVQAKVDELPVDALARILLLLEREHVMVEKLLQLLVGQVDAQLLKAVELQNHKASRRAHGQRVSDRARPRLSRTYDIHQRSQSRQCRDSR
jgi:hypothetical protein